jgi:hypothetical protein
MMLKMGRKDKMLAWPLGPCFLRYEPRSLTSDHHQTKLSLMASTATPSGSTAKHTAMLLWEAVSDQ